MSPAINFENIPNRKLSNGKKLKKDEETTK